MSFKDPWILLSIPFVIALIYYLAIKQRSAVFRYSSVSLFSGIKSNLKIKITKNIHFLRLAAIILFLIALAAPRSVLDITEVKAEGIDIVLAVDASGSMAAEDFVINGKRENRLKVVKDVVSEFVENRINDRIGLVVFAGRAYTVCPLTTDYDWLNKNLERVELELIKEDGTAVGSAIASSLGRLQESDAKSKVIILLTDGVSNAGEIEPITAANLAKTEDVKIYTIGAGTKGLVPYPALDFFGRRTYQRVKIDLDEKTLNEIAKITDGKYFRATDTERLRDIYKEIDELEKTEIIEAGYKEYKQLFAYFLLAALLVLILEILLKNTLILKIP